VSFRKAITLDPQVYDYHYWYGRSLAKKGEAPEARREFLIAIQLNHDATEAKLALAELTTPR
jgi:tetratricopeptide (TPR) repeat protein